MRTILSKYRKKIYSLYFVFLSFGIHFLYGNEAAEFWQIASQPLGEFKKIDFSFRQEYRFNFSPWKCLNARFSLYSKKVLTDRLDTEFHYTLIFFRGIDEKVYKKRHRFEFELNPNFKIQQDTVLFIRNRFELIKFENRKDWDHVFRQRIMLSREINKGILKTISSHNEIFFSLDANRIFEYRYAFMDLLFDIGEKHAYRIFTLYRWIDNASGWKDQLVLGSSLEW